MFGRGKTGKFTAAAAVAFIAAIAVTVAGSSSSPVTVKLAPAMVSVDATGLPPKVAHAETQAVWRLFDRDTDTAYTPMVTSRITVSLPGTRTVSSIRVYGASSYQLNLYRDNDGAWEPVSSLTGVNLTGLAPSWNSFAASKPFTTSQLLVELVPQGNVTAGLKELEISGPETTSGDKSESYLTLDGVRTPQDMLDILAKSPSHIQEYPSAPSELSVPGGATPAVSIGLTQAPALFKRAYILYDGYRLVRSVSIQRRINGLSWSGGFDLPQPDDASPSWSSYLEEINPAWLVQGENKIEFRTTGCPAAIRGLKLVVETDSGWNAISDVSAKAAYDGDLSTSYAIAASSTKPSIQINFERVVQPETLRLNIPGPMNITAGVQYQSGGAWQDMKTGWQIDLSILQAGWNDITLPAAVSTQSLRLVFNTDGLRVKSGVKIGAVNELMVSASPVGAASSAPRIVISYPRDGEYFGRTAYLQGFATPALDQSGNAGWVGIEGKDAQRSVPDGSFSIPLTKDETHFYDQADDDAWQPVAQSAYDGQTGVALSVLLNKNTGVVTNASPDGENRGNAPFTDKREHHTETVSPGQAKKIQYKGVTLDIPQGAVDKNIDITIVPLTEADLAHYDPGMINVTYPAAGYRFLPHGTKFKKPITVSFTYAKQLFSAGQTDNDVNMYYYDESLLRWQQLNRVSVDQAASLVTSLSDHFTDIINSTLVTPEHPQALSFNPNSLKDIKAADPSAGANLIEPPKANNKGTANLSYPIEVPPGRNKLQPNISLQYNSSGGNGWTGLGWDVPMQAISIDTRWGVPRYDSKYDDTPDSNTETETYLLDGEQLTPLAHRGALQPRTSEKVFHTRVEGQFRKIIRHGSQPNNYWWEVIDKNGTKYFYGGKPDSSGSVTRDAVLAKPGTGDTFKWALRQIRDTNGNTVNFTYAIVQNTGIVGGSVMGYQIYLTKIDYTGHNDAPGAYSVIFTRDREMPNFSQRPDVPIDARSGFKMVTADLLKRIDVRFKDAQGQDLPVRSYTFDYLEGAFKKKLLLSVSQYGSNNTLFNKHEFSYYDNVKVNDAVYNGFDAATDWNTSSHNPGFDFLGITLDTSAVGASQSTSIGGTLYLGFSPSGSKFQSIGVKKGSNTTKAEGLIAMIDINGDGLPDKVFKCGDNVCYNLNASGPRKGSSYITFEETRQIPAPIFHLSQERSDQSSTGVQGFLGEGSALYDTSETIGTQSKYFTDVNGDGLVDLVDNGVVFFNHLDSQNHPVFTADSNDTPAPIGKSIVNVNGMLPDFSQRYEQLIDQDPLLDSVRRWVAPYDGVVSITGGVQLADTTQDRLKDEYTTTDGVRVAVQKEGGELWSDTIKGTDFSVHNPSGVDAISVNRGDHIYFRVQSVFDGSYDQVQWDPVITYVRAPAGQTDVNGLPVYQFTAADDMIYGGRVFPIKLPFKGKLCITGDLVKNGVTTDDVTVALYLNDAEINRATLPWDQIGAVTPVADDIDVRKDDVLVMKVLVDSDIDQKQIEWKPQVFYVEAYYPDVTGLDANGAPAKDQDGNLVGPAPGSPVTIKDDKGNYIVQMRPFYDVDFYPGNSLSAPQLATKATTTGTMLVTPVINPQSSDASGFSFNSDVVFTVKRRTALLGKSNIPITSGAYDGRQHSFEIAVNAGDELFFDFSTRDQGLAGKIQGVSVTAHYITPDQTASVTNVVISLDSVANPPKKSWTATETGTATITPSLATRDGSAFDFDSTLTFNAVVNHADNNGQNAASTHYTRRIAIVKGGMVNPAAYASDVPVASGDVVNFYYTTSDPALPGRSLAAGATVRIASAVSTIDMPSAMHGNVEPGPFSKPYRGWGYIVYDGNRDRATEPIHQELLAMTVNPNDYDLTDPHQASSIPIMFYPAVPDASQQRWTSVDQHWWISPGVMSSSRLGIQFVSVPTPDKFNGAVAVPRITQTSQTSFGQGYYVAISLARSVNETILDYQDMNGDGYPDVVGQLGVQYTDMLGTLNGGAGYAGYPMISKSVTDSGTLGPGGTVPNGGDPSKPLPPAKNDSQNPSFGFSGSLGMNQSEINCQMMDMNGDGLPDSVCENDGMLTVQLNLGYGFALPEGWGAARLSRGQSINGSLSVSYSDGAKGFAGGPSVSLDTTQNEATFADMNGDGLPDRVYNNGTDLQVGFNTGAGLAAPVLWTGSLDHKINTGLAGTFAFGVSVCDPILIWPAPPIWLILNPEANGAISLSREQGTLRDVKGDGAPKNSDRNRIALRHEDKQQFFSADVLAVSCRSTLMRRRMHVHCSK